MGEVDWEEIDRINRELDDLQVQVHTAKTRAGGEHITSEDFANVASSSAAASAATGALESVAEGIGQAHTFLQDYVRAISSATARHVSDDQAAEEDMDAVDPDDGGSSGTTSGDVVYV